MSNDWFRKGASANEDKDFKEQGMKPQIWEFWLKPGESADIVFTDDEPVAVWQHIHKVGEKKFLKTTCPMQGCVDCAERKPKIFLQYYNILDLREYTTKKGEVRPFTKKAIPIPKEIAELLARRRQASGGSLKGKVVSVTRDNVKTADGKNKTPACGNDFLVKGEFDLKKIPPEIKPYDFVKALAPLSTADRNLLLRGASKAADDQEAVSTSEPTFNADEEIPF